MDQIGSYCIQFFSKLTIKKILVVTFILALTTWCCYNVAVILQGFFAFDTFISLYKQPPNGTDFPGITICAPAIFTPKYLAGLLKISLESLILNRFLDLFPEFNNSYNRFQEIKREYPEIFTSKMMIEFNQKVFRKYENMALMKFSAKEVILNQSVQYVQLLEECTYHPIQIRTLNPKKATKKFRPVYCNKYKLYLPSIYDGRKCFTFFSDLVDVEKNWKVLPLRNNFKNSSYSNLTKWSREKVWERLIFKICFTFCLMPNEVPYNKPSSMEFDLNSKIRLQIRMQNDIWDYLGSWSITLAGKIDWEFRC